MKAIITVIRETTYSRIVEMSQEQFDAYTQQLEGDRSERRSAEKELNQQIKPNDDWQDDDLKEATIEIAPE